MRILLTFVVFFAALAGAQEAPVTPVADAPVAPADSTADAPVGNGVKTLSGMSILGNEEAPKSLVIVPWKSSKLGDGLGVGNALDERAGPVDKEVFMRELRYYELRSGRAP